MKAVIRGVSSNQDKLAVSVDYVLEEGDFWYDQYLLNGDVLPFRTEVVNLPVDVTVTNARSVIRSRLLAYKRAHARVEAAQQFVGIEITGD